jgi:sensor histidine kinase regulating citrate/malate metabolism
VKNREEVKNIISQLIENSIKAIEKSNVGYRPTIRINGRESEDSYVLTIEDVGPGIPKDVAEKIFETFSGTSSSDLAERLFGNIDPSNNTITVKASSDVSKQLNRLVIQLPARHK